MRITCYYPSMGYIYLKPHEEPHAAKPDHNNLKDHITTDKIKIPYTSDERLEVFLNQMSLSISSFRTEQGKSYETEYGNDMDEHGYLTGIELNLSSERFIDLVSQQTIQIIKTSWREKALHLIAFDQMESVLQPYNHIYKLTDAEDTYVIVYLEKPENLGIVTFDDKPQLPIALFKAFLTTRDDIYPLEYLLKPDFVMIESSDEENSSSTAISSKPHVHDKDVSPEMKELLDQIFGKSDNS